MKPGQRHELSELELQGRAETLRKRLDVGIALLIPGYCFLVCALPLTLLLILGFLVAEADGNVDITDPKELGELLKWIRPTLIVIIFTGLTHEWRRRIKREERLLGVRPPKS